MTFVPNSSIAVMSASCDSRPEPDSAHAERSANAFSVSLHLDILPEPDAPGRLDLRGTGRLVGPRCAGVANTVDPLGGSYFIEALTKKLEDGALEYFDRIDAMGGMVEAVEKGFPQREIQESAYQAQRAMRRAGDSAERRRSSQRPAAE